MYYNDQLHILVDSQRDRTGDLDRLDTLSEKLCLIQERQHSFYKNVSGPQFADDDTLSQQFGNFLDKLKQHGDVNFKLGKDLGDLRTVVELKRETYRERIGSLETDYKTQIQEFVKLRDATEKLRVKYKAKFEEMTKVERDLSADGKTVDDVISEYVTELKQRWQQRFDEFSDEIQFANVAITKQELKTMLEQIAQLKLTAVKVSRFGLTSTMDRSIEENQLANWVQQSNSMRYSQIVSFLNKLVELQFLKKFASYQLEFYQLTDRLYEFIGEQTDKPSFYFLKNSNDSKYVKQTRDALSELQTLYYDSFKRLDEFKCELDLKFLECARAVKLLNLDLAKTVNTWVGEITVLLKLESSRLDTDSLIQVEYYNPPVFQLYNPARAFPQVIFGVDLVELSLANGGSTIPLVLHCILRRLDDAYDEMSDSEIVDAWNIEISADMFELRRKINGVNEMRPKAFKNAVLEMLGHYDTRVVVALLRQFFIELPNPLFSVEEVSRLRRIMEHLPDEHKILENECRNLIARQRQEIQDTFKALAIHVSFLAFQKLGDSRRKTFIHKFAVDFASVLFKPTSSTRHWCFVFTSFCIYHRTAILQID